MVQFHGIHAENIHQTAWLSQFLAADLPLAQRLAESIRFVSDTELKASLDQKLIELLSETDDRIALFVEREQKHPGGKTQRLYKQKVVGTSEDGVWGRIGACRSKVRLRSEGRQRRDHRPVPIAVL